jgi:hypothetical protein
MMRARGTMVRVPQLCVVCPHPVPRRRRRRRRREMNMRGGFFGWIVTRDVCAMTPWLRRLRRRAGALDRLSHRLQPGRRADADEAVRGTPSPRAGAAVPVGWTRRPSLCSCRHGCLKQTVSIPPIVAIRVGTARRWVCWSGCSLASSLSRSHWRCAPVCLPTTSTTCRRPLVLSPKASASYLIWFFVAVRGLCADRSASASYCSTCTSWWGCPTRRRRW